MSSYDHLANPPATSLIWPTNVTSLTPRAATVQMVSTSGMTSVYLWRNVAVGCQMAATWT